MSRLLVAVVFISCFVGCYPEPKLEPVQVTADQIEQMSKATNADGTPLFGGEGRGRSSGQKEK